MKLLTRPTLRCCCLAGAVLLSLGCKVQVTQAEDEQPAQAAKPAVAEAATLGDDQAAPTSAATATNAAPLKVIPPDLKVSPAVGEIINLAQGGVGDEVLLAYIEHAAEPFNLTADDILYLSDLGLSDAVITAMVKHRGVAQKPADPDVTPSAQAPAGQSPLPPSSIANNSAPIPNAPPVTITATPEFEAGVQQPSIVTVLPPVQAADPMFYSTLAPYGYWIDLPEYGLCWQPTVAVVQPSWKPYSDRGRWIYSDCGWYWQSDYSWGWAPFHYGRWFSHPHRGWVWAPDRTWGPAWVTWRYSDSYCGWAPLPPGAHFRSGIGLSFHTGRVGIGFDFGLPSHHYTFLPTARFGDPSPWHHYLPHSKVVNVYNNTTVINNYVQKDSTVVNVGVNRDRIAALSRYEIRKASVRELPGEFNTSAKPDRLAKVGRELVVYRPPSPKPSLDRNHERSASADVKNIRSIRNEPTPSARPEGRPSPTDSVTAPAPAATASAPPPTPTPNRNFPGNRGDNAISRPRSGASFDQPATGSGDRQDINSRLRALQTRSLPSAESRPASNDPVPLVNRGAARPDASQPSKSADERRGVLISGGTPTPRQEIASQPAALPKLRDPDSERRTATDPRTQRQAPTLAPSVLNGISAQPGRSRFDGSANYSAGASTLSPASRLPEIQSSRRGESPTPNFRPSETASGAPERPSFRSQPIPNRSSADPMRRELAKPATIIHPDKQFAAPTAPNYQPAGNVGRPSSPQVNAPTFRSAPQYAPTPPSRSPSPGAISAPPSRQGSSPVESRQSGPSVSSAPRTAPQASPSSGSSRRDDGRR